MHGLTHDGEQKKKKTNRFRPHVLSKNRDVRFGLWIFFNLFFYFFSSIIYLIVVRVEDLLRRRKSKFLGFFFCLV